MQYVNCLTYTCSCHSNLTPTLNLFHTLMGILLTPYSRLGQACNFAGNVAHDYPPLIQNSLEQYSQQHYALCENWPLGHAINQLFTSPRLCDIFHKCPIKRSALSLDMLQDGAMTADCF